MKWSVSVGGVFFFIFQLTGHGSLYFSKGHFYSHEDNLVFSPKEAQTLNQKDKKLIISGHTDQAHH